MPAASQKLALAQTANENGDYDKALQILDQLIDDNNKDFAALIEKAFSHQKLKDYDQAIYKDAFTALQVAKEQKVKNHISVAYNRIGIVFYLKKQYFEAFKYLKYAERYEHDNPDSLNIWLNKTLKKIGTAENAELNEFLLTLRLSDGEALKDLQLQKEHIYGKEIPPNKPSKPSNKTAEAKPNRSEQKIEEIVDNENNHNTAEKKKAQVLPKAVVDLPKPASVVSYPPQDQVRKEFYETSQTINVSIYIKKIPKDGFKINFLSRSVEFEFKTPSGSDYVYSLDNLAEEIDTKQSTYDIYGTKLELSLHKLAPKLWKTLQVAPPDLAESSNADSENAEGNGDKSTSPETASASNREGTNGQKPKPVISYPSSSKKHIDWAKLDEEFKDVEDDNADDMKFFKEIFKNADPDTRRAMEKSYVESGGTALSTNWKEVSNKKYEIDPPEGMVAKKWNE